MTEMLHPTLLLFIGAAVVPLLSGRAQQAWMLLIPAAVLGVVFSLQPGSSETLLLFGMELQPLRVDALSLVFVYVFAIITFIGALYAIHVTDSAQHAAALAYAGSAIGVVLAGDLITLYVFWEVMVFTSVWLVWCRRTPESLGAGIRYLLVHAAGGVILLAGIILHAMDTGSVSFGAIDPGSAGFYLILVGFMLNAAVPPLHAWLTDAYPEATITGAIFMASLTTKTAVYTLIRGYPGTELLVVLGVIMTLYGVTYAVLANDIRRLLAYHIISQVGYMVTGVGLGTIMAINGSASHAFTHILYKALLFMGAGALIHMTGRAKLTELGGLYRYMPATFLLYMIGGFSISALPLTSGFVSKTMIVEAAALEHRPWVWLLLALAPAGTFLSTTLKLPWFAFFGQDSGLKPREAPWNMLLAMGLAAFLCIFIGVYPGWLYAFMPEPVTYNAYSVSHVLWELQLLGFTAVGFFLLLRFVGPSRKITVDVDVLYRKLLPQASRYCQRTLNAAWGGFTSDLMRRLRWIVAVVNRHHGPQGALARTWPTGSMVFWVAVMLAASLLVYYF